MSGCEVCTIQATMEAGGDPFAVARLESGYVQLYRVQYYPGYTFFSSRSCVAEVFDLDRTERALHQHEMAEVAAAVDRAFSPQKMNIEALGNSAKHLHWHLIPRPPDDVRPTAPVWENLDFLRAVWTEDVLSDPDLTQARGERLHAELERSDVTIEESFR